MNGNVELFSSPTVLPARPAAGQTSVLSPAQQSAYEKLEEVLPVSPVIGLVGPAGSGRSTIARILAETHAGRLISMSEVFTAVEAHTGDKWEEAVGALVMEAFDRTDLVVVDDFTSFASVSQRAYTRMGFFAIIAKRLCEAADQANKCLVLVGPSLEAWESISGSFGDQAVMIKIPAFTQKDYEAISAQVLGSDAVAGVDFRLVYSYAGNLQGYQLRVTCQLLAQTGNLTGEKFIKCLEENVLSSNLRIHEVEALSLESLPGAEEIVEILETNIVLPFENRTLAQEMGLKPKRGVLLYGPPGTGKTSIGRALAHRMKGKFFLVDGTFLSEPPNTFFMKVLKVVEEAKLNSPSVLFIDDADVLFKIEHIAGLVRYLLSLLDGLESETASDVCVMMTAMNVKKIPEALLRSGRVELWLEMKLPTEETRGRILQRWMGTELPGYENINYSELAKLTAGFTPADLRRITGDAKSLYAADIVAKRKIAGASVYLARAVEDIITVRSNMADTLADESLRAGPKQTAIL